MVINSCCPKEKYDEDLDWGFCRKLKIHPLSETVACPAYVMHKCVALQDRKTVAVSDAERKTYPNMAIWIAFKGDPKEHPDYDVLKEIYG